MVAVVSLLSASVSEREREKESIHHALNEAYAASKDAAAMFVKTQKLRFIQHFMFEHRCLGFHFMYGNRGSQTEI